MVTKLFEIRDSGTFIPIMATKLSTTNENERFLLSRSGYGPSFNDQSQYVILTRIDGGDLKSNYDALCWGNRTMTVAHHHIEKNFNELNCGEVIDIEYILGETKEKKKSEILGKFVG